MKTIAIPYFHDHIELHVDEKNLKAVLLPRDWHEPEDKTERQLILDALRNPIGSPALSELSRGKRRVVIVTSDHTRAVPSRLTLPILLSEVRRGNPAAEITILIATGLHRATTEKEQRAMFGDDIVDHERIAVNDAFRPEEFVRVCELPSGASFCVNRLAAECDLLIAEGFIEPHFFAGFSGGRKSILPGVCSEETVNENHSFQAIAHANARTGVLEQNPVHADMIYAARAVNLAFILNVAMNEQKRVIAAFAGDMEQAHETGTRFIHALSCIEPVTGDIVVTGNAGYPMDQNLYQASKSADTAESCAGEDGVIIVCASCCDGMGGEYFERLIHSGSPSEIEAALAQIPPKQTIPEQWVAQIYARIMKKHRLILVSGLDHETVRKAGMIPASSPDEALALAYRIKGQGASVVVIPNGISVYGQR
jgi:nickel-dependent lactate racemase